jgi:hypothetical protein
MAWGQFVSIHSAAKQIRLDVFGSKLGSSGLDAA